MTIRPDFPVKAHAHFASALANAQTPQEVFAGLEAYVQDCIGVRLFTVMTVDMEAGVARRAHTNMPDAYPTSDTKPVPQNHWFTCIHEQHATFVANTIEEIAEVFPDYALIDSLGCQSVVNLPIVLSRELIATVNMLDPKGGFPPERVTRIEEALTLPGQAAIAAARLMERGQG